MSPKAEPPTAAGIADLFRKRIKDGELLPGTQLAETGELATELGADQAVVTLAMQTLRKEGLVETRGRVRWVTGPSEQAEALAQALSSAVAALLTSGKAKPQLAEAIVSASGGAEGWFAKLPARERGPAQEEIVAAFLRACTSGHVGHLALAVRRWTVDLKSEIKAADLKD